MTEAFNEETELFGEEQLEALLAKTDGMSARTVCGAVAESLQQFVGKAAQSDDITMLCVRMDAMQESDRMKTYPDDNSYAIVQTFLNDRLGTVGVSPKVLNRVQVANDEIWSNIVHYSGASEASLHLRREGDTLYLDYADNGTPYDPTKAAEVDTTLSAEERSIGGLGLHMVRKMTTSMTYVYAEGQNRLSLGFDMRKI